MDRNDKPTMPPGPEDANADAFAHACKRDEWSARLENVARLHAYREHGNLEHDQDAE